MNSIELLKNDFFSFLAKTYAFDQIDTDRGAFALNTDENKQQFGDITSNAAMLLAKKRGEPPRALAQSIATTFSHEAIKKIEVAGPGFLNIFLTQKTFQKLAFELFVKQETFFKNTTKAPKKTYSIECVSANPTGPLHLGHGRGGIIGDVLGNILNFVGHTALKEYYINDAGNQITKLGNAFKIRCQQAAGLNISLPENSYHGEYLITLAKTCLNEYGKSVLEKPESFFQDYAKKHILTEIKETLSLYGIHFDIWFSEKTLHDSGAIAKALKELDTHGYLYEEDGALWFKSTKFGDDKDRVVRKKTGELTYVAADIAYMQNKIQRGADHLVMILGHDHHSYVTRLQGIHDALDLSQPLEVILYQLVKMKASGELVRMSKRAGNIVTLKDCIELVGADVARFFYLNRKADAQLEFNLDLALKKTEENPVFYIQYAYVRIGSILHKARHEAALDNITTKDLDSLSQQEELLIKKIVELKELLATITENYQTHLLSYYAIELAQVFHSYYAKNRIIDSEAASTSRARLALMRILRQAFATTLTLLGISRPDKM